MPRARQVFEFASRYDAETLSSSGFRTIREIRPADSAGDEGFVPGHEGGHWAQERDKKRGRLQWPPFHSLDSIDDCWWRGRDLNSRPLGYEPIPGREAVTMGTSRVNDYRALAEASLPRFAPP